MFGPRESFSKRRTVPSPGKYDVNETSEEKKKTLETGLVLFREIVMGIVFRRKKNLKTGLVVLHENVKEIILMGKKNS